MSGSGEMRLHIFGPADGRPVLWLHGWLGCGREGEALASCLGPDIRLVCPDLPGHGGTPLQDWHLADVLASVAEMGKEFPLCMGYSMGGRLLMMAAARFPAPFRSLVVESASPGYADPEQRAARRTLDAKRAEKLRQQGVEAFCHAWYQAGMWGGLEPPHRTGDANELAGALERFGSGCQPDLMPWLCRTRHRILWLAGRHDSAYAERAATIEASTPHTVVMLDGGHNLHRQCPQSWAAAVNTFQTRTLETKEQ